MNISDLPPNRIVEIEMNLPGWARKYRVRIGEVTETVLRGEYRVIELHSGIDSMRSTQVFQRGAFNLSDIVSFKVVDSFL